jgi:hypothetical protein
VSLLLAISVVLLRTVVAAGLFLAPFVVAIGASRKPENLLYLIFPFYGAIPALAWTFLVLVPLELWLAARGLGASADWAVPAAGASLAVVVVAAVTIVTGRLRVVVVRLVTVGWPVWGPIVVWAALGAAWGVAWRVSARVVGAG